MIHVKKKKLSKNKLVLIFAIAFALLVALAVVLYTWSINRENDPAEKVIPEIIDGEALINNLAAAYPEVSSDKIQLISIQNKKGAFDLMRDEKSDNFMLYYTDSNGDKQLYYPDICDEDFTFEYQDLYALEMGDGFKMIPKLTYLCVALEIPYFSERIYLSENAEERDAQLRAYGLTQEEVQTISFLYLDEDGKEQSHAIRIGAKSLTGKGYYFMVDGRDCVYMTTSDYYSYALSGFASFIKPLLVAEGIEDDNGFEPYLTTNYYQWLCEMHETEGDTVTEDSRVIVYSDMIVPSDEKKATGGYILDGYEEREFDLSEFAKDEDYDRLIKALVGKKVGALASPMTVTLFTRTRNIDFSNKEEYKYKYVITDIEGIITDREDITEEGSAVGENNLIKVAFYIYVDGKKLTEEKQHAVIDLSEDVYAGVKDVLKAEKVGKLSEDIELEVSYNKETAIKTTVNYVVEEIISIYGKDGKAHKTVGENSIVSYRMRFVVDGEQKGDSITAVLDFSTATSDADKDIRAALLGKSVSKNLSIPAGGTEGYYEHAFDFAAYEISRIDYFVTKELVTAFRFQNNSERDPYYGESLYENLMVGKYSLYGLNAGTCESVVRILGGISLDGATSTSAGLFGDEALAVGLTPEVMKKYGLYAHTVYFELPRGIYTYVVDGAEQIIPGDVSSAEVVEDYSCYDTLGFTLYISEEQIDGTRYIASDLYDVVTRVNGDDFVFLDHDFASFWARRNIILINVGYIENLEIEFNMSDIKGGYDFDVSYDNNENMIVAVTPTVEGTSNKLVEYIDEKGYKFVSLTELYNHYVGGGAPTYVGDDTMGATYFKETILGIFFTRYQDVLTEQEQAEALSENRMLMRIKLDITTESYKFVYEFYRIDDRRVMVRIYREDLDGVMRGEAVSDFYISILGFKKIVNNFLCVLNAEEFERHVGYPDDVKD